MTDMERLAFQLQKLLLPASPPDLGWSKTEDQTGFSIPPRQGRSDLEHGESTLGPLQAIRTD